MDELSQLEQRIEQLLARLEQQASEISRLEASLADLKRENADLVSDNHKLKESLSRREAAQQQALRRIEALMGRIQGVGCL
ncbi:MAG: DNA replication initiation control protein YabA [Desulfovibrio sp.]|nr:DNA replication initiation control protein YabA [Desulfovibrio sp.]